MHMRSRNYNVLGFLEKKRTKPGLSKVFEERPALRFYELELAAQSVLRRIQSTFW